MKTCVKCEHRNGDDVKFCAECGNEFTVHDAVNNPDSFKLTIMRKQQLLRIAVLVRVALDHARTYRQISDFEEFDLSPGKHMVILTCWGKTTRFEIDMQKDEMVYFKFNRLTGRIEILFCGANGFIHEQT